MATTPYWGGSLWNLRPQGYDLNNDGKIDDRTNSPELFTNFLQDRFNALDPAGQAKFGGQFQGVLNALNPGQWTFTVPGETGNALHSMSGFDPWMQEKLDSGEWIRSMGPEISVDDAIATLGIQDPFGGMRMPTAEEIAARDAQMARKRAAERRAQRRAITGFLGENYDWSALNQGGPEGRQAMQALLAQLQGAGIKASPGTLKMMRRDAERAARAQERRMLDPNFAAMEANRAQVRATSQQARQARQAGISPAAQAGNPVAATPGQQGPAMQTKPAYNKPVMPNMTPGMVTTPGFISGQPPANLGTKPAFGGKPGRAMTPRRAALQQRMGGYGA